jgi:hypothetical protein
MAHDPGTKFLIYNNNYFSIFNLYFLLFTCYFIRYRMTWFMAGGLTMSLSIAPG